MVLVRSLSYAALLRQNPFEQVRTPVTLLVSWPFCNSIVLSRYIPKLTRGAGPVRYIAPEDKEVWFCNCKQTSNRPFCDGTHRTEEVTESRPDGKIDIWEPRRRD